MDELKLKPHKQPQPQQQQEEQQPQPQPQPPTKKVILLFGRGTVQYDQSKYTLIVLTGIQPHPLHQPEEWLEFVKSILRAFSIARVEEVVIAVERAQVPTLISLTRNNKKFRVAPAVVKDGKVFYPVV